MKLKRGLEPVKKHITVMFLDIVGYSRVAEVNDPKECFADLKNIFSIVRKNLTKHKGVIGNSFGDGLMCIFGDQSKMKHSKNAGHADLALACAVDIQRIFLDQTIKSHLNSKPIYPLRIGINSSEVIIGNFGDNKNKEIAIIGHGVNVAKQLESACDGYSIMVGPDTLQLLCHIDQLDIKPHKRLIHVKHHEYLTDAYECNPFEDQPEVLNKAMEAYRAFCGLKRQRERWPVPSDAGVTAICEAGKGDLVDFSEEGVGIRLPVFLGKGVHLQIILQFPDSNLNNILDQKGVRTFVAEVKWAKPTGQGYMHGLQLKFQNKVFGPIFVSILKKIFGSTFQKKAA